MQVIEKLEADLENAHGTRRIDLLVELAVYLTKTDPARGVEMAEEALALARRSRDELRTGRALQARALTSLDSGGSLEVVRRLLGARRIFENCRSVPHLADIHRNRLLAYAVLGNVEEAREALTEARRLLSFARLPEGGGKCTNLNETISGVESLLRPMMPLDFQIWLDLDPDVPLLAIEPARVEQVILNLAINARDAMPGGGILDIRTERGEDDVLLTVRDSGSGMDEETAARIFEPFFTTKGEEKGTGLGLYTVRDIVEAAGGTVRVDTGSGVGTTFTLSFPLPEAPLPDEG